MGVRMKTRWFPTPPNPNWQHPRSAFYCHEGRRSKLPHPFAHAQSGTAFVDIKTNEVIFMPDGANEKAVPVNPKRVKYLS